MFHFIENLYSHARNTLVWFIVYFVLQMLIWLALAVLVLVYPQTLFILVAVFFVLLSALNIYLAIIFARYLYKLVKVKNTIQIK